MQWSSKSIAKLAAALAKAQAELVNPEKSLVATIYPDGTGEAGKSFRYASLASGLEIVRKTLSQHAIAAVQTTAVDEGANIVKLTTVLAHSSGEWIASDWPVCAVSETAAPHRMGAALTYARRYALFTLVGIAGEDDLDAPDLPTSHGSTPRDLHGGGNGGSGAQGGNGLSHDRSGYSNGSRTPRRLDRKVHSPAGSSPTLGPEQSAALRNRLVAEIAALSSADDAALWARRCLAEKNQLTAEDAGQVELAFQSRLADLEMPVEDAPKAEETRYPTKPEWSRPRDGARPRVLAERRRAAGVDKAVLALPEPRRVRDREHVKYVAQQPCLVCGRTPCDPHHLRFRQSRALGRKVSDEYTVPLCRGHHREVHRHGDESAWWEKLGIDPAPAARTLWLDSHPLPFGQTKGRDESTDPPLRGDRRARKKGAMAADGSNCETKPFARSPVP